jgi:hypothetical protein
MCNLREHDRWEGWRDVLQPQLRDNCSDVQEALQATIYVGGE